ncbi:hypothetical protein Hdeb2414_s0036g00731831 [Helianthus debilis subsp. tardiflorus]
MMFFMKVPYRTPLHSRCAYAFNVVTKICPSFKLSCICILQRTDTFKNGFSYMHYVSSHDLLNFETLFIIFFSVRMVFTVWLGRVLGQTVSETVSKDFLLSKTKIEPLSFEIKPNRMCQPD